MFNLAPTSRYRLDRPPLVRALTYLNFDLRAAFQTLDGVAAFQAELETTFPYMEERHEQQIGLLIGPGGITAPPQTASRKSWLFTDDAGWSMTLAPDSALLAVGSEYETVDDIAARFTEVIRCLSEKGGVKRCTRLGVRYINVADISDDAGGDWQSWFRPEMIGWAGTDVAMESLVASVTQTQLNARPSDDLANMPGPVQGVIRHGVLPPNAVVPDVQPRPNRCYLLDIDTFVQTHQALLPATLVEQFGILHSQIDRFFRWTLAPNGERRFGLREVA